MARRTICLSGKSGRLASLSAVKEMGALVSSGRDVGCIILFEQSSGATYRESEWLVTFGERLKSRFF